MDGEDGVSAPAAPPPHPKSRSAARLALRRGPTIDQVAAEAGVSRGTVSRFLNGGHYVSPRAQAAIESAVERMGYVANQSARSLVTKRSNAFAFVLPESQERLFEDPNFAVLMRECTDRLAQSDRTLVLMVADTASSSRRVLQWVQGGHVDGVLLVSAHQGNPLVDALLRQGVPAVAAGRPLGHEDSIPYVSADDRQGARQMTEHLFDRGRERVAIIAGPADTPGGVDRLRGYRDVVDQHGAEPLVAVASAYSGLAGEAAMDRLLEQCPDLDGVFAASDLLAVGALSALRRSGRTVPDDVALGGFDDSQLAEHADPPLTTVRQPMREVGSRMVEMILAQVRGETVESQILGTSLIVRSST